MNESFLYIFTAALLSGLPSAGTALQIVQLIQYKLIYLMRKSSIFCSGLVGHLFGTCQLNLSLQGVALRQKTNRLLLPLSLHLPSHSSVRCRPPARSNTVNLILTNKPGRLGSRSWPGFAGSAFCHTLNLKGAVLCVMRGRWCFDGLLFGGVSSRTCEGVLQGRGMNGKSREGQRESRLLKKKTRLDMVTCDPQEFSLSFCRRADLLSSRDIFKHP